MVGNFQQSLDKYLTTPPDDGSEQYIESVADYISDEFAEKHEEWFLSANFYAVCDRLFEKGVKPEISATIIERWYKTYIINNEKI